MPFNPFAPAFCDALDFIDDAPCPPMPPLPVPSAVPRRSALEEPIRLPARYPVGDSEYGLKDKHPDGFALYVAPAGSPPGFLLVRWESMPLVGTKTGLRLPEEVVGNYRYRWHFIEESAAQAKLAKLRVDDAQRGKKPKITQRVAGEPLDP
ncbi:MAG: hypothetical protein IAE82_21200, partial [Opitutaceae bacterium]|nr:hypothetical protein [Opitutaceae bacterium]